MGHAPLASKPSAPATKSSAAVGPDHGPKSPGPASVTRLTELPAVFDVGEQMIGSDHVFELDAPWNSGTHTGAATVQVAMDSDQFHLVGAPVRIAEAGAMAPADLQEQLTSKIRIRFTPSESGYVRTTLTLRAAWNDGHVERQVVTVKGRARLLDEAPRGEEKTRETLQREETRKRTEADARAADEERLRKSYESSERPHSGHEAQFNALTEDASLAARSVATRQKIGLKTVEDEIGTYVAPPSPPSVWWPLVEAAITMAGGLVAARVGSFLATKLASGFERGVESVAGADPGAAALADAVESSLGRSLAPAITAQLNSGIKAALASAHTETQERGDGTSTNQRIAFFQMQQRALVHLEDENARMVADRAKYLRPLLKDNFEVAKLAMQSIGETLVSVTALAERLQSEATAAQWVRYRARIFHGTESLAGGDTVTNLNKARPSTPKPVPASLTGLLDIGFDIDSSSQGVRTAYLAGVAQPVADRLGNVDLRSAGVPLRIVVGYNTPEPAVITRDEAGRVRVSGKFSRLSSFHNDGVPITSEAQAELAAHRVVDIVMSRTMAAWHVPIRTDDSSGGK